MLVRPTLAYFLYFFIPFIFLVNPRKKALHVACLVLIGFLCGYGPWVVRNSLNVPVEQQTTLAAESIHKGIYPWLMYKGIPRSLAYPDYFDPNYKSTNTLDAIVAEAMVRLQANPVEYTAWFLVGKPFYLFSWDLMSGDGDVYLYPIKTTPFLTNQLFSQIHKIMKGVHWPLVVSALLVSDR